MRRPGDCVVLGDPEGDEDVAADRLLAVCDRAVAAANIFVPGAVDGRRFDRSMT